MKTMGKSIAAAVFVTLAAAGWTSATAQSADKIFAQQLVEEAVAKHSELAEAEMSSTPPGKTCNTIASTDAKGIGAKCDKDEFTALKSNKPFVEKEIEEGKEVYDITMPLHDSAGKVIGTVGLDFKPEPNQQQSKLVEVAQQVVREMEDHIPTLARLFEPTK